MGDNEKYSADAQNEREDAAAATETDAAPTFTDPNQSDTEASSPHPGETQDAPLMDQHDASIDDKINGIVAQTRIDVPGADHDRIVDVLRQRFSDAGIGGVDDDRFAALAKRVAAG
ncbi:hypothetical protein LQ938_02585 [Microbacterium sp. cx-55]|uniref:hypothetical protein n=1 Tax=unclassified Microbacterium TaxID=2609290 RepID=UPI001CBDFDCE|nr:MULTISPECIES: hypothetical protein [unclassified Microbacterium]MBZ4487694.1 hypothetical protein [Microbacterium sp. cx-55]MCC4908155.1 hypothetical protein [Microbacterium sp. cx-59]UGB35705.1 hypothetical protein LQ938_02585 [Microbacterium sp. cx-55]